MKKHYSKEVLIKTKTYNKKILIAIIILLGLAIFLFTSKSFYNIDFNSWQNKYNTYIENMNSQIFYYKIDNKKIYECSQDEMDIAFILSKKEVDNNINYVLSYVWTNNPVNFDKYQIKIINGTNIIKDSIKREIILNSTFEILDENNKNFYIAPGSTDLLFENLNSEGITKGPYTSDIISFNSNGENFTIEYEFKLEDRKNTYKITIPSF